MSRYSRYSQSFGTGCSASPVVQKLIIINVIMFLATSASPRLVFYLGLLPFAVTYGHWYWQFLTYMFLHGGFFHILFNMYALLLFGSEVEGAMGSKSFLRFYMTCGIGAGIITYLFGINVRIPTIGASGAIFGILVAYGMMFPNRVILAFFIIPMKAWQFVIFFGLIELFASVSSAVGRTSGGGIAHNAHLGGLAIGFIYIRYGARLRYYWRGITRGWRESRRESNIQREVDVQEYIRREIDPILDKISKHGMDSLSRKEKKKLRDARDHLR